MNTAKKGTTFKKFWKNNIGFLFIIPWLIGFCIFKLYPFASSLYFSFTDFHLFKGISKFTLDNYTGVFTNPNELKALIVTFKYAFITVPLKLIAALFIAYILNFKIKGVNFFRTAYYIPSILGGSVAISVLWKALFKDEGLIQTAFAAIGVSAPSVPKELEEAAKIDGCNVFRTLIKVIVPMLMPAIVSCALFKFMWASNDFLGPLLYVNTPAKYPATIFVKLSMDSDAGFSWNRVLATSLISILPSIAIFFAAQNQFVEGISAGGVKG